MPTPRNDPAFSREDRLEISRQARLELARRAARRKDILAWGQYLFPDKFPLPFCPPLHGYFVDIRDREFTNTEAPRFHAKTTIKCFLIPLFQALEEPTTFRHYLNVQSTDRKALAVNTSIRAELERNEDLLAIYGDQVGEEKWTDQQFVLKNGVVFTAVGAGQSIRGIHYENRRPDYVLVDDLYDDEDINNPESTTHKNEWLWGTLYPAMAVGRRNSFHVQGTAINSYDIMDAMKKNPAVASRTFQAIVDDEKKLALWPEGKSYEALSQMRENMGTVIFNREMQNERRQEATSIIKSAWIKTYDPLDTTFGKESRLRLVSVLLCCDPSIGQKEENDATALVLILKARYIDTKDGHVYFVQDVWNEHLSLDARIRLMLRIADAQPKERRINQVRIEAIAGFKDFAAEVRRRTDLPVREIDHVKDKITNLETKSHFFENGKVFISSRIDPRLRDMLIHQLTTNHPKHDDLRDGTLLGIDNTPTSPTVTVFDND